MHLLELATHGDAVRQEEQRVRQIQEKKLHLMEKCQKKTKCRVSLHKRLQQQYESMVLSNDNEISQPPENISTPPASSAFISHCKLSSSKLARSKLVHRDDGYSTWTDSQLSLSSDDLSVAPSTTATQISNVDRMMRHLDVHFVPEKVDDKIAASVSRRRFNNRQIFANDERNNARARRREATATVKSRQLKLLAESKRHEEESHLYHRQLDEATLTEVTCTPRVVDDSDGVSSVISSEEGLLNNQCAFLQQLSDNQELVDELQLADLDDDANNQQCMWKLARLKQICDQSNIAIPELCPCVSDPWQTGVCAVNCMFYNSPSTLYNTITNYIDNNCHPHNLL